LCLCFLCFLCFFIFLSFFFLSLFSFLSSSDRSDPLLNVSETFIFFFIPSDDGLGERLMISLGSIGGGGDHVLLALSLGSPRIGSTLAIGRSGLLPVLLSLARFIAGAPCGLGGDRISCPFIGAIGDLDLDLDVGPAIFGLAEGEGDFLLCPRRPGDRDLGLPPRRAGGGDLDLDTGRCARCCGEICLCTLGGGDGDLDTERGGGLLRGGGWLGLPELDRDLALRPRTICCGGEGFLTARSGLLEPDFQPGELLSGIFFFFDASILRRSVGTCSLLSRLSLLGGSGLSDICLRCGLSALPLRLAEPGDTCLR
jgi:hypothetical protein